jgi:hypothetical protein
MGVRVDNSTAYVHPDEPNLLNLHKAMEYNLQGQPIVRVKSMPGGPSAELNDSTALDAFGRQRVSMPYTEFDCSFRYSDNSQKWNHATSGTAVVSHLSNESSISLSIGTGSGDSIVRETLRTFSYQPGKSLQILSTFVMSQPKPGLQQRVGYFGVGDGVYFMTESTEKYLVIRKSTSGSVDDVTEKIPQSQWNVDTMVGVQSATNPSGLKLDITKSQIFWTDIEWLGVGSVRCGFIINGVFVLCHVFHHANLLDRVYMKTATLPLRYEITNIATTTSTSTLKQICSTVISEGGYINKSISRSVSTPLAAAQAKAISEVSYTPMISIRLRSDRSDTVAVPKIFDIYGLNQSAYQWAVIFGPTLTTGSGFISVGGESSVEYNTTATGIIGGTVIASGIFVGDTKGGAVSINLDQIIGDNQLQRTLGSTGTILCVAAKATSNNDKAVASLNWQEFT